MDKYLAKVPMVAFALYFIKVSVLPISYPESACLAVLGLVACYFQFRNNDEKMKDLETKFDATTKKYEEEIQQIQKIRDVVNGLKMNSLTRPQNVGSQR